MNTENKNLWQLLWDYDPNGLVAVNKEMIIQVVNPAFCKMFRVQADNVIGAKLAEILREEPINFRRAWEQNRVIQGDESAYLNDELYVRKVIFPILKENIVACIMVDLTREYLAKKERKNIHQQTVDEVNSVLQKQMEVAQTIAGLLGEATAESKISMLKLVDILQKETGVE
ncbi:MAG: PAS domain-containing protein [Methanosarcinaceae archaeon]|nr:PAS domain-containing protein [Methanosarcinaceae archaeon]